LLVLAIPEATQHLALAPIFSLLMVAVPEQATRPTWVVVVAVALLVLAGLVAMVLLELLALSVVAQVAKEQAA
jgi:hypothetical protein